MTDKHSNAATEKDLVEEVENLLASPDKYSDPFLAFRLLRRLKDEVKALRVHVVDLNHDFEAANKHCEEYHYERPVE